MGKEPVTGLNTLNGLLRMLRIGQIDPCHKFVKHYSRLFLIRELNLLFNRLRQEDQLLSAEDISKISDEVLSQICFDRGIDLDKTRREKIEDLRLWLSISNLRNVPHSLLLITRVNDFAKEILKNDEDVQLDEVMRQVSNICLIILFFQRIHEEQDLEYMKKFERTFAIDQLEEFVLKMIEHRRDIEFNPQQKQYQFTADEYIKHTDAIDEFKTRHSTISNEIDKSNQIGLKLEDYLHSQIIIDFHFRGEQDVFEAEYPNLIDKAQDLLGEDLYTELSQCIGEPLSQNKKELYDKLLQVF